MTVSTELSAVDRAHKHMSKTNMVTSVGIAPVWLAQLTVDDANQCALYCGTLADISSWTFSDLLVWSENKASDTDQRHTYWAQLCQISKRTYAQHTLLNMTAVARAFPWDRRRHTDVLSFRHHRIVMPMSTSQQDHWLDLAQDMNWSCRRMEIEIRDNREEPLSVLPPLNIDAWAAMHNLTCKQTNDALTLSANSGKLTIRAVATEHGTATLSVTVKDNTT